MDVKGRLVVKVSPQRASELRDAGLVDAFAPGHGRPMKQWLAADTRAKVDWLQLSREELATSAGDWPHSKVWATASGLSIVGHSVTRVVVQTACVPNIARGRAGVLPQ
jgi:hypothetical protein